MTQKTGALIFDETADRYDIRFDLNDYYGGFPLFRSISQDSPLFLDKESGAIERRRSIRQIRYIRYMGSRWADTP